MSHSQHRSRNDRRLKEELLRDFFAPPLQSHRYRIEKVVGKGAYGVVCSARDAETGKKVAVKRIKRVLDSGGMATRILRELKFLRLLNAHENIVTVKDVLIPSEKSFNDVFVVMELMPTDLGKLIRSKTVLVEQHIKFFMFQLLSGVNFLHAAHVFHRDLNPNNILVNSDCQLRICDFGLARVAFHRDIDHTFWTDYVATRWYRAPELILASSTNYSTAIDMWSVGCIFAEMLGRGKPLFPGNNEREQFALILNVTGKPSREVIQRCGDERLMEYLESVPNVPPTSLSLLYRGASAGAVDLLGRLLTFDPNERITAADALALPYFDEFRSLGLGATTAPLEERQFQFERRRLTMEDMRKEFMREIMEYHPELREGTQRRGRYLTPSPADQFQQDMDESQMGPTTRKKHRTLSSDVFVEINPMNHPEGGEMRYYPNNTFGEAEFSKIGGVPVHHASSYATHGKHVTTSSGDGDSSMKD